MCIMSSTALRERRRATSMALRAALPPRSYASLFFVAFIGKADNELITLEIIHAFVEILDRYFGNVCELDIIFNFHKARTRLLYARAPQALA